VPADDLLRGPALDLHHEAQHLVVVGPREGDAPREELVEAAADGPVCVCVCTVVCVCVYAMVGGWGGMGWGGV
jgi:hypothetical protein